MGIGTNSYGDRYLPKPGIVSSRHLLRKSNNVIFQNVTINRGFGAPMMMGFVPEQPKTNWWALGLGAVTGFLGGAFGSSNSTNITNTTNLGNPSISGQPGLANLKTLFPNHQIVDNYNGTYTATDKSGKIYKSLGYDAMCDALAAGNTPKVEKQEQPQGKVEQSEEEDQNKQDGKTDGVSAKQGKDNKVATGEGSGVKAKTGTGAEDDGSVEGDGDGKGSKKGTTINNDGWTNATKDDIESLSGSKVTVHDHVRGSQFDVSGNCTISKDQTNDGFPKTITVNGQQST